MDKIAVTLTMLAAVAGCARGPEVETLSPHRGEIRESFSEPARTRLSRTYLITMPLQGRIGRIALEPGDKVEVNQELASFDREPLQQLVIEAQGAVAELQAQVVVNQYDALEHTLAIELRATVDAARDALKAADAQVEAEQKRAERADKERSRIEQLAKTGSASQGQLDDAALQAETALIELRQEEFVRAALNTVFTAVKLGPQYVDEWLGRKRLQQEAIAEQLVQARARLARARYDLALASVRSPITGVVLARYEQGDAALAAGQRLLLLGNLDDLEVVADVLTQDAMRLHRGSRVSLAASTYPQPIQGTVKRIEPAGFTKLSSLGVEQQRVNVIVGISATPDNLGVGYQLQARFFTGTARDALIVPRFSVLQAPDQSYYVFKIADGRLQRQAVQLGLRNDLELQVTQGLSEADEIVASPDTTMRSGERVVARQRSTAQ